MRWVILGLAGLVVGCSSPAEVTPPPTPDMAGLAPDLLDPGPPPPENVRVNDPTGDDLAHDHTIQTETSIALFGDTLLVSFLDTGHVLPLTPGVSSLAGYAISTDHGHTFSDLGQAPPTANDVGRGYPVVAADGKGTFYLASQQRDGLYLILGLASSTDGGRTFARPVLTRGLLPDGFNVKPALVTDNTGGANDGQVYLAWTESPTEDSTTNRVVFVRSTDHGQTLSAPISITPFDDKIRDGSALAVGVGGEVYAAWPEMDSDYARGTLMVSRSLDGGVTWSPPAQVGELQAPPFDADCASPTLGSHVRNFPIASLAVDHSQGPHRGRVYLVYESATGSDAADVYLQTLDAALAPVGTPLRVNDDQTTTDQAFPSLAVAGDGTIGVGFLDRRRDPQNVMFDFYFAISRDGGAHFEANRRITEQSFGVPPIFDQPTASGEFDSERQNCFIGDNLQVAADAQRFYMAWGDGRNSVTSPAYPKGRLDLDVYFASLPVAATP